MLNILLSVVCYDLWFYTSHVLLHSPSLYPYHSIHHQYEVPTYVETYTGHWTEGPFQGLGALVPWTFMEVSWFDFAIVLVLLNMRGMMRHDERFVWLIGNHHLLHHKFPRYNYGEYWLDSLFGTRYPDETAYKRGLVYI